MVHPIVSKKRRNLSPNISIVLNYYDYKLNSRLIYVPVLFKGEKLI